MKSNVEKDCIVSRQPRWGAHQCRVCGEGPCRVGSAAVDKTPRSLKIYLAAPFGDRPKMEIVADRLKAKGHTITARWVYGGEEGLTREDIAKLDLDDVDACDTLISFTFPRGTLSSGGGRHVEFGYALARGKRLIVIGERENVFHHFPGVEVYASLIAWMIGTEPAASDVETVS